MRPKHYLVLMFSHEMRWIIFGIDPTGRTGSDTLVLSGPLPQQHTGVLHKNRFSEDVC